MSQNVLAMSTLLIQMRRHRLDKIVYTSFNSLDEHSIQCTACFDLHVDSVNKQHCIHNNIALKINDQSERSELEH